MATGIIKSVTNEAGKVISYTYDASNRQTNATLPEGNYAQYSYDSRGNITEVRQVSKTPGTQHDIVTSAAFPTSCTNPRTCNKPTSTTDATGQTDYTYDSAHGGVLSITAPAAMAASNQRSRVPRRLNSPAPASTSMSSPGKRSRSVRHQPASGTAARRRRRFICLRPGHV